MREDFGHNPYHGYACQPTPAHRPACCCAPIGSYVEQDKRLVLYNAVSLATMESTLAALKSLQLYAPLTKSISSDVLSVLAIALGSKRNLDLYLLVRGLQPPLPSEVQVEPRPPTPPPFTTHRRSFLNRIIPNKRQLKLIGTQAVILVGGLVLPRLGIQWSTVFEGALSIVFPQPKDINLTIPRSSTDTEYNLSMKTRADAPFFARDDGRCYLALAAAVVTVFAIASGFDSLTILILPAWVLFIFTGLNCSSFSTRGNAIFILSFVGLVTIGGTVGGLIVQSIYPPNLDKIQTSTRLQPSAWLLDMIMIPTKILLLAPPAAIISLTHRFEATSRNTETGVSDFPSPPSGAPRLISSLGPLYCTGLIVTSLTVAGVIAATEHYKDDIFIIDILQVDSVLLTTIFPLLGIGLAAWMTGNVKNWWSYHEL
ncbi:hypothetical protein BCR39DRAFT_550752 [Naematelia encephala]|uniref:Uncharacterized protein n=1 Tax=Naematelia encephala TaxID=71784 RepID=A0A1Y2AKS5_9TREE|nr:hypothetical protein BCR39DRAFT_550752 [Naematelia encephala]